MLDNRSNKERIVITKNLLMKLGYKRTTLPLQTKDTYPTLGDVVVDIDGAKLLVVDCDFF